MEGWSGSRSFHVPDKDSRIETSASLPGSRVPIDASSPSARAGLIVDISTTCFKSNPSSRNLDIVTVKPKTLSMDQKNMTFIPHVLVVTKGDTVKFLNHDNVAHNVYSPDNDAYNLGTFKQNEERTHTFDQEGAYTQLCSIHPEMLGYIFVGQNPYAAPVDAKGHYAIKDVPAGTYQLEVWNPKLKAPAKSVTVAAGQTVTADLSLKR